MKSVDPSMEGNGDRKLNSYQIGISWTTVGAGGSARIFRDLAKGLPAEGVGFAGAVASPDNVSLLSGGAVESFCSEDAWAAVRLMAARRVILSAIRSTKPDLVASHFALFAAPIADQLRRQAHVVHFHGPWAAESKLEGAGPFEVMGKSLVERMAYSTADRVIVLSSAFAKIAHRAYGIPEEILRIVPGAVDVDRFNIGESQREARELLGWPTDRRIIVSVRRLVSRMGLGRLISAFGSIHLKHPETVLYIVGKGRLRAELEQRASALNLQEKIRFHGFVADEHLPLVYRAADFSIVPTTALEGFGLVAAESLAAGTPCVVTPVGGLPDIVAGLSGSLILRSIETVDLADGLSQILSGATILPSGARCIEHVMQNFTVDLMARRTAQVYREALRTK